MSALIFSISAHIERAHIQYEPAHIQYEPAHTAYERAGRAAHLRGIERLEDDELVQAVQELGAEAAPELRLHRLAHRVVPAPRPARRPWVCSRPTDGGPGKTEDVGWSRCGCMANTYKHLIAPGNVMYFPTLSKIIFYTSHNPKV